MKNREWMEKVAADLQGLSNYAAVKDRLAVKLTGRAGNEEILEKLPHHDMEDMAVIYKIRIYGDACKTALAAVTNTMLKQYGITAEQLHRDAVEAASAHQPYVIRTMAETLNELCGCTWKQEDAVPMYVATNTTNMAEMRQRHMGRQQEFTPGAAPLFFPNIHVYCRRISLRYHFPGKAPRAGRLRPIPGFRGERRRVS